MAKKKKAKTVSHGIRLHLGCGDDKQEGFIGMDNNDHQCVDIVHHIESFPYPIDDESCHVILAAQVAEHIDPRLTIDFFNELWRIMRPGGQLILSVPYAGSIMYWDDPTHCNGFIETTFSYFDFRHSFWQKYKPCPWSIDKGFPLWQSTGLLECVMTKVKYEEAEKVDQEKNS
jgi:SAM-dependent methyltransferase